METLKAQLSEECGRQIEGKSFGEIEDYYYSQSEANGLSPPDAKVLADLIELCELEEDTRFYAAGYSNFGEEWIEQLGREIRQYAQTATPDLFTPSGNSIDRLAGIFALAKLRQGAEPLKSWRDDRL
jgi:hypothetical protein